MYLGNVRMSNEYISGTAQTVIKIHVVTGVPESECWDARIVNDVRGTPRKVIPGRRGHVTFAHVAETDDDEHFEAPIEDAFVLNVGGTDANEMPKWSPEGEQANVKSIAVRVTREDVIRHAMSEGCNECKAIGREWKKFRAHSC